MPGKKKGLNKKFKMPAIETIFGLDFYWSRKFFLKSGFDKIILDLDLVDLGLINTRA